MSDKIHFMQFTTESIPQIDLDIGYTNRLISKAYDTKFLGIYIYIYIYIYTHSTLSWKNLVEQITQIKCSLLHSEIG